MIQLVHFFESSRLVKQSKMMKLAIFACLCAIVLVEGQVQLPDPPPMGIIDVEAVYDRVARNAQGGSAMPGIPGMPDMGNMNPVELGMKGLGMIPDPTAVIAKAQEVGRQIMGGRGRRHAGRQPDDHPPGEGGEGGPGGHREGGRRGRHTTEEPKTD